MRCGRVGQHEVFLSGEDGVEQVEYDQQVREDEVLGALEVAASRLEAAGSASILPLTLQEFLVFCRVRRGLALTRSGAAALCEVAAACYVPEPLAELCTRERCLWVASSGAGMFVAPGRRGYGPAGKPEASDAFVRTLADAGITWYALLPLALPEGEAMLVALGAGDLPLAVEQQRALRAGAVLGTLATGALERSGLRQAVARQEHTLDEFIGLASHELKSPLTVIKGYSQLLLRQARRSAPGGAVDVGGLEAISQQVSRMSTLVGELLDFSRIERGTLVIEPMPVDVVAMVSRLVEQRQRALPHMHFSLTARESVLLALADRLRLEQVLGYLLDNAIKFGRDEGMVEVGVQRARAALLPPALVLGADGAATIPQEEMALISIRDHGPGLPAEEQAKLFTAFYRGPENSFQRQYAGLGLGLYLSRYLVARQHGCLWAEFPMNGHPAGGIFSLALPLAATS